MRPVDGEVLEDLVLLGHSLAIINLAWGWSRPERGVNRWVLVWGEVGTVDKGHLGPGVTIREGLCSP